jgi:hypothetical protein
MFIIRKRHMDACAGVAMRNFEDRVLEHLRESSPDKVKDLGEPKTREAVQQAVKKAQGYGLVSERDICMFIDVAFKLGMDFDQDPRYPWAAEILEGRDRQPPATRADRLLERANAG